MKRSIAKVFCTFAGLLVAAQTAMPAIMDADVRRQKLDTVHELVSNEVRPIEMDLISAAPNPFVPNASVLVETEEKVEVILNDTELLAALSEYINPTGIFLFGGEFYLVFKEKKLKVGSEIGITYNGTEYSVTIAHISGSNYTVRRGNAELQLKLK